MLRKIQLSLGVGLGLILLQTAYVPQAQAFGDGPPLRIYYCYHVVDGVQELGPYAMIGPNQTCPPPPPVYADPNPLPGSEGDTETEHDCQVVILGGEV